MYLFKMLSNIVYLLSFIAFVSGCPNIISRDEWGARQPETIEYSIKPVRYVIIHHTESSECYYKRDCIRNVYNIQSYHMDQKQFDDIGYNFLIGMDGNIYEGRGWHKIGAHMKDWNSNSIGIGFIGNFETKLPTSAALRACQKLLECGVAIGELEKNYRLIGARQVSHYISPGLKLYRNMKKWRNWTASP